MSLIGRLEQLGLANVLQRIEAYAKTGAIVIKQEGQWVELYFRDGKLMCIGPVRANATLGERLLQAGVISVQGLQEALFAIGGLQPSETRMAITLMDLGHVSQEDLRSWAMQEASTVIQFLLTWQTGEIYFEEGLLAPPDRLMVAISITSQLPSPSPVISTPAPARIEAGSPIVQEPQKSAAPAPTAANSPALLSASQLISGTPALASSFSTPESSEPVLNLGSDTRSAAPSGPLSPPTRVSAPLPAKRIDTTFMQPEMVLMPVDLSALRQQNPQVQLTPEQWRLLTRVDGHTSLQMICFALAMPSELVCQVAGELIAQGLVNISMPLQKPVNELSPISRDLITAGLGNGYVAPGYAASTPQPWGAIAPTTDVLAPFASSVPFETQSQWGNGANGAIFVPGRGWITTPLPLQPLQPSGPIYTANGIYAYAGGER